MNKVINSLILQFKEVYEGLPWLDESFAMKLNLVNERNAFIQPQKDIHSIAEILSHLIVWRVEVLNRLKGNPRQLFEYSPENWISSNELKKKGWDQLLHSFKQSQKELLSFLNSKDDDFLSISYFDKTYKYLVEGLLHHDLYHLGQIGLVQKMLSQKDQ
jgi:uncharacterized damage-inducible protein DinB